MKPIKFEMWSLERLVPFDKNPRIHPEEQIQALCRAIEEFGFTDPIIVSSKGGILAGHGRYQVAWRLHAAGKLTEVPVIILDHLDEAKQKAFIIAHNKIAEKSSWHKDYLSMIVQELTAIDFELGFLCMDSDEIEKLMVKEVDIPAIEMPTVALRKETLPVQSPAKPEAPQPKAEEKKAEPLPVQKIPPKVEEKKEVVSPKKSFSRCPNCSHEF